MGKLVLLYIPDTHTHAFDAAFSGKSAFERALEWALRVSGGGEIVVAVSEEERAGDGRAGTRGLFESGAGEAGVWRDRISIVSRASWTLRDLLEVMVSESSKLACDTVVFTTADRPFLNINLTRALLESHKKYISEYTFQDGYPGGFAPEIINVGTLKILLELAKTTQRELGSKSVTKDSLFELIKTDINAFEIESVIAPKDYRMLRLDFSCNCLRNLIACKRLYDGVGEAAPDCSAKLLADYAARSVSVQKTLPAFYEVQIEENILSYPIYDPYPAEFKSRFGKLPIASENNPPADMALGDFERLIQQIEDFSEDAVVSLSAFGEPLLHKDFSSFVECVLAKKAMTALIETDGLLVTDEIASSLRAIEEKYRAPGGRTPVTGAQSGPERSRRIIWIVKIDAATEACYNKIVRYGDFKKATDAVGILQKYFPGCVYPQFTRMNENEDELESVYRYWSKRDSPSGGNIIIQKYNDFCGALPPRKVTDVSPITRMPCWHLKRDMVILRDGSVPLCKEDFMHPIGNVFKEDLESIWERFSAELESQIDGVYNGKCRNCDEYYTFNF